MTSDTVATPSLADLISLKGRRALITGAARGIGLATAMRLAEAGADLLLGDLDEAGAREAARTVAAKHGTRVEATKLDVADSASMAAFAKAGVERLGGIDIFINNAGIYPGSSIADTSDDLWERIQSVNLRGTFNGCREAAKVMLAAPPSDRHRVIVNIASVAGVRGRLGLAAYSAAKSGVIGLTRSVAVELAPHKIRVLCVTPSMAETPGVQEMRAAAKAAKGSEGLLADMEKSVLRAFPMGRTGQADEIARVILFCASELSAFMTGSNVLVDGGLTST
jgi:NAD(P)-dependent dehydrogenase (short-subunit alcohol dehydrogenase family)